MSIINNVLKDLESRSSQFIPIDIASVNQTAVDNTDQKSGFLMVLLTLLTLAGLGFWYYQSHQLTVPLVTTPSLPEVLAKLDTAEPVEVSELVMPTMSNQIIGLQIRESSAQISLEFAMREKAVSYLKERSENSFVYHIKNIDSEIEAPRITENRWIENLSIIPVQQGVDVTFKTVTGVLVNTEQLQKKDEAVWIIRLEKLPGTVVLATLETAAKDTVSEPVKAIAEPLVDPDPVYDEVEAEPVKLDIKSASQTLSDSGQLNKAVELLQQRQWRNAETILLGLIGGVQDIAARKQLLGIYARPGYSDKYADLAKQSNTRYPQEPLFVAEYARSLFQQQSYDGVIALLSIAETLDSVQQALMAASYQRLDQHEKAIKHYHHSLKLDKQQARNWIGLGISLEHEARLEKALQSYQTAARLGNMNEKLRQFVEQRSRLLKQVMN